MTNNHAVPNIDISLLRSDKDRLLEDLRHALVDYGFFTISNYDEYLDHNIVLSLGQQAVAFFKMADTEKSQLQMAKSKNFLGYNGFTQGSPPSGASWKEEIDFCSIDEAVERPTSVYDNVIGENQYPPEDQFPFFRKSIKNFFESMNEFSLLITRAIFETLQVRGSDFDDYIDFGDPQGQFSEVKTIHYPSKAYLENSGRLVNGQTDAPTRDSGFLTFLFQPTVAEESLQFQDIYGEWTSVSPDPNTIVCNVGQTLEYLTNGVCVSSVHRTIVPKTYSRISIPYYQNVKLNSKLRPFNLPLEILQERDRREELRQKPIELSFDPHLDELVSKRIFHQKAKLHRHVTEIWYPDILQTIDNDSRIKKENEHLKTNSLARRQLLNHLDKIKKIFKAFISVLILNLPNHTADIKLHLLVVQVQIITRFGVQLNDLLRVAYIWPDFVKLKVNDDGDVVIDIDHAVENLDFKSVNEHIHTFNQKIEDWFQINRDLLFEVPAIDRGSLETTQSLSLSTKLPKTKILQRVTRARQTPHSSLSLLDRIRLKEKERQENQLTPEAKYDLFLFHKLGQLLDILASLNPGKPLSMDDLTAKVADSMVLTNYMAKQEASDLIIKLSNEFPDDFRLVETRKASILKWDDFDVNEFKSRLKYNLKE